MMKLKVCGMKQNDNINQLVNVAPDYMGLIFHEKSPRNVDYDFSVKLPDEIKKVGVFVNETEGFILDRIERFDVKYIQLHGEESPHFCKKVKQLNRKIIKAFNIHEEFDFSVLKFYEPYCDYFLFDAFGDKAGGNGITFNWELLANYKGNTPFFLSGGIKPSTVDDIKSFSHPQFVGVDINSGFEIEPGLKNIDLIQEFKDELFS
jgi:phosphoribosylanthranilate isomerase